MKPNHRLVGVCLALFCLFEGTGCQGCKADLTPDAGTARSQKTRIHSIDVRTALFTVFPEFRWAVLTRGSARVERVVRWSPPKAATPTDLLLPFATEKGFSKGDGGHDFVHAPFALDVEKIPNERFRFVVGLPLQQTDVGRLLQSPAPMTSDQLAHWLPLPPDAEILKETFVLDLEYVGKTQAVTDGLVRQMIDLLLAGPWTLSAFPEGWQVGKSEDGGFGRVPAEFEITLHRIHGGTEVQVNKRGDRVAVRYLQPLTE